MTLTTRLIPARDFCPDLLAQAFALYQTCYAPTDAARFAQDFGAKSYAVTLWHGAELAGFSTVERIEAEAEARVLYSGDTVIAPTHWGTQALPYAWLRAAGQIWAEAPARPLYWMLITKGHRTYRYLPGFARAYWPAPDWPTPPEMQALMHRLGGAKFSPRYRPESGIIAADPALPTHVIAAYEGVRPGRFARFFATRNPGFAQGDELLALCRLAPESLTPRARRQFLLGAGAAP